MGIRYIEATDKGLAETMRWIEWSRSRVPPTVIEPRVLDALFDVLWQVYYREAQLHIALETADESDEV